MITEKRLGSASEVGVRGDKTTELVWYDRAQLGVRGDKMTERCWFEGQGHRYDAV